MGSKTIAMMFMFGATIASGQFMPRLLRPTPYDMSVMPYFRSNGCPSGPELAPVICQFMEPHMGLFKPQLIAPTTYIPPLVVEKCDKPQLEIQFPPKKPIVIPEAPVLPPITIPKFPVPLIQPLPPVKVAEPCEPAPIAVTSGAADLMVTGVNIPAAPILPPLEMPALPEINEGAIKEQTLMLPHRPALVIPEYPAIGGVHGADMSGAVFNDQSLMVLHHPALVNPGFQVVPPMIAPYPEDEPMPVPIPEVIAPLAPIPAAPELPPARLPEIPVHVEIPPKPIMPPMIFEHVEEPCITGEMVHPKPVIPSKPIMPSMIFEHVEEPCITGEIVHPKPVIPSKPIMPSMIFEHVEEPCITGDIVHPKPVIIAQPPRIPEPMPIFPAHEAIIAEPCEPAIQSVMKMSGFPYFVRATPSYIPAPAMGPVFFPTRGMLPNVRRI